MAPSCVRLAVPAVLFAALGTISASAQEAPPLRLRPGDSVRLEVRDEPDLAGDFQIDESGRVLLPLIGLVSAADRDFADVRAEVEMAYDRELSQSEVRVTPLLRVAVLGEVRTPGLYPVDPTFTLGDVLALAGGLGPEADEDGIALVREGRAIVEVDAQDLVALALPLRSGDQLVVGRRGWIQANAPAFVGAALSLVVAVATTLLLR
jgi:polysaccharide export outer membrane protein